jgi:hypothetical protein
VDLSRNLSKFPAKVSPLNDFLKAFEILYMTSKTIAQRQSRGDFSRLKGG